ncbi:flippase-like domain-containing protein [Pseudolysobacter antarcticus]|uniref:Flippase-like domain-containing protein n=1 Tax=Pseudolysobacter antarcticus TaxID=2511995 RepID=A0A411HHU2_9GAMM|nr:lysylphosphatidylglycerol synthase transmembrane domain-containing protein [Pseudolysobacter antarcticus]QBB70088.1 flippase-like domain-containing protein [Pseudolysobacter antarcticus]
MRRAGSLLITLALIAALAVPMLLGGRDALATAWNFPLPNLAALTLLTMCGWLSKAQKLRVLLRQIGAQLTFWRALGISLATDFAFMATPAGAGGYPANIHLLKRAGVSTSSSAAAVVADQLLDLLFFAAAIPLSLLALLSTDLPTGLRATALGIITLLIVMSMVIALLRHRFWRWIFARDRISPRNTWWHRRQRELLSFLHSMRLQGRTLTHANAGFYSKLALFTALQWLTRYGALWLVLLLLGYPLPFAYALLLQALILHAAQWTGVPSGAGGAELGLAAALASWAPASSIATTLLLWRYATLYLGLAAGGMAWLMLVTQRRQHQCQGS